MKNQAPHTSPPKWPLRLLRKVIRDGYLEEIEGDMEEVFQDNLERYSLAKARRLYAWDCLKLLRPALLKNVHSPEPLIYTGMFRHNLLITYRSFLRDKTSFLINLIGLSSGLACVLLIYLWVNDEVSIDRFHEKDNQLYQVMTNFHGPDAIETWETTPILLAETFMEKFPEVESATLTNNRHWPIGNISHEDNAFDATRLFADERFFEIFSYDLIQGNRKEVLADKNNIVLSEKLAKKLFNSTTDVVGKTVEWSNPYFKGTFLVSGIFETPPANSTKQFDAVIHYDWVIKGDRWAANWNTNAAETFLVLREGANIDEFNDRIEKFMWSKVPDRKTNSLFIQQYSQKYLNGRYENGILVGGRIEYIRYFSIIALFILLIACINFMNLSTAQASRKMKEIGVKKTIGASRKVLMLQFLSESMLMVILASVTAIGLVYLFLPQFNEITGKPLLLTLRLEVLIPLLGIVLFTGLIAGSYPAFYLSGFRPIAVLKGKLNNSTGELWVRKGLVVFQFALSVIFIVGVWIVNAQMDYTQSKNPGYSRDNVISFQRPRHHDDLEVFLSELQGIAGVAHVSNMAGDILSGNNDQGGYSWRGQESDEKWIFKSPQIGFDVIETLGMEIVAGRSFSREHGDDDSKAIFNESAIKMMQLEDPIGKMIDHAGGKEEIIGVVADFHYGSLHHKVKPLVFRLGHWGRDILVKIKPGTEKNTIEQIEERYEEFHPGYAFNFSFLDDDNQRLYEAESRVAVLSKFFAGLAIIISCLGLFGLAAFTAERRSKEIGIRKILGSSVWGIIKLLSTDFTKMVFLAIVLALPISYLLAHRWLENFAYKIEMEWWFFAGAALITLLIAWLMIGFQTLKAARINPAECLRDE